MKTTDKIIQLIKAAGPMTAKVLAEELGLTTMGVRQHMLQLENDGEVVFEDKKAVRGRPTRYWSLTDKSNSHFPNAHEELTVQLIDSVKTIFGDEGLDKLITHREKVSFKVYQSELQKNEDLFKKLKVLAHLRSNEGYMAVAVKDKDFYWLLENHCPICSAATHCLNFCRSELNLFQALLDGVAIVTREEHIIEGARRCAYRIVPVL